MPSVASLRRVAAFARNRWPESAEYARYLLPLEIVFSRGDLNPPPLDSKINISIKIDVSLCHQIVTRKCLKSPNSS
jgi:hypothetical protein